MQIYLYLYECFWYHWWIEVGHTQICLSVPWEWGWEPLFYGLWANIKWIVSNKNRGARGSLISASQVVWSLKAFSRIVTILSLKDEIRVPVVLQEDLLNRAHVGLLGVTKCHLHTANSIWWLSISQNIERLVHLCQQCSVQRSKAWTSTSLQDATYWAAKN